MKFSDTVNWTRGAHTLNLGPNFTQVNYFQSVRTFAPQITFGVDNADPVRSLFSTANLPGASNADVTNARNLYATLVGSVTTITANSFLDEEAPLLIMLAYFSRIPGAQAGNTANYTSTLFTDTTFVNPLVVNNAAPFTFAQNLYNDLTRRNNALAVGLAPNFFLVNPNLQGGSSFTGNGGHSYYDSAVVELRRRMSKGLLVQGSYVFARGYTLTNSEPSVSLRDSRFPSSLFSPPEKTFS